MKRQNIILGGDIKLKVSLTALDEDVTLDDISYKLTFTAGSKSKEFSIEKTEEGQTFPDGVVRVDEDSVCVSISTSDLDRGDLFMLATAYIDDSSFSSGTRTEIVNYDTGLTLE